VSSHSPLIPSSQLKKLLQKCADGSLTTKEIQWLAALIDHTLLKPGTTQDQLKKLCAEAQDHQFGAVCVTPENVKFCVQQLKGSGVKVAAVAGFPEGSVATKTKVADVELAISSGAQEIDMVIHLARVQARKWRGVYLDIRKVVQAAGPFPVKVILETCLLSDEEKWMASSVALAAGAAFLKTSTGFSTGGATLADVALLRSAAGATKGVKASGGVRTTLDALKMVQAGANRIGTSNGVAILGVSTAAGKGVY
jgi:deoxyribose-phosphate aldolase